MKKYPWLLWEQVWGMTQLPVSDNLAGMWASAWLRAAFPAHLQAPAVPAQYPRLAFLRWKPSGVTADLDLVLGGDPIVPRDVVRPALPWWRSQQMQVIARMPPWHVLRCIQLISEGSRGDRTGSDVSKAAPFSWCVYQDKKTKSTVLPIISPTSFLALIVRLIP